MGYVDLVTGSNSADREGQTPRPYIGVHFECCDVYTRVYRQPVKMEYHCRCPRCMRMVRVRVGPEGTNARFFCAR